MEKKKIIAVVGPGSVGDTLLKAVRDKRSDLTVVDSRDLVDIVETDVEKLTLGKIKEVEERLTLIDRHVVPEYPETRRERRAKARKNK